MAGQENSAISIRKLTKKFGDFTAVDGISLEIRQGEIFGLLGPNGAGKTTTISMLCTLLKPSDGKADVWGHDIAGETDAVRKSIGIVFQDPSLDDELTGRENMEFHGRLYGMPAAEREKRISELLKLVDLEKKGDAQVKTYSGGMKRRLEIARGLMHFPKVLFLDEPTIGLDPQTRRKLWEYIKQISTEHNLTVILTTHYMEEADVLCDRIAIIDHGKIIALDLPKKLKESLGGDIIVIEADAQQKMIELLKKEPYVREAKPWNQHINIVVENGGKSIPKIIALAQKNRVSVNSVSLKQPNLEDVFIHFTGRTIREEEADSADAARKMRIIMRGR